MLDAHKLQSDCMETPFCWSNKRPTLSLINQVKKADASRIFILHHYGGMYLDLDIECYRPAENAFKHYDVVLQGTGFEGVNNGMMASAPGHPIWMALIDVRAVSTAILGQMETTLSCSEAKGRQPVACQRHPGLLAASILQHIFA